MRALAPILASLLLPALLSAQQVSGPSIADQRARLQRELDRETYAAVARVIDATAAKGIPIEPLFDKAFHGAMRQLSGQAIANSVTNHAARLEAARRALDPASAKDVEAGAVALANGVPATVLTQIRQLRPNGPVFVELGVLAQLVANKVPLRQASEKVVEFMKRGSHPNEILAFGSAVSDDVARGLDPRDALSTRTRGMLAGSGGIAAAADAGNREALANAPPPGTVQTGTNRTATPPRRTPRKP